MVNDMTILYGIITFLISVGIIMPYMNDAFDDLSAPEYDVEGMDTLTEDDATSLGSVIGSVVSMFFWSFGILPLWIDLLIFLPLRFIALFILARNIWIGGGG